MGQDSSVPEDLTTRVAKLRERFGRLPFTQLRDPAVIADYEKNLAAIIAELEKLIAEKKVKEGHVSVVNLRRSIDELAEILAKWRDVAEQALTRRDPETGEEFEPVTSALVTIIEPDSTILQGEGDGFLIWLTIHDSSAEQLKAAGRRVRRYRELYKDYTGLLDWIATQKSLYTPEQVELFYNLCTTPPEQDDYLTAINKLLDRLDHANRTKKGKFEQDLVLARDYTKEEQEAIDEIVLASHALLEFLRANGPRFAHVKILGQTLEEYLIVAMQKGKCNNDLVALFRKALQADYRRVPKFVQIYIMLDQAGYFKESGEL